MTTGPQRATPACMPKHRTIPPAPSVRRETFQKLVPTRGWPDTILVGDTGVLLAVCREDDFREAFQDRYAGRLVVADAVEAEINTIRTSPNKERSLRELARSVRTKLFDTGLCTIDEDYDSGLFNATLTQLQEMRRRAGKSTSGSDNHAGEAASIALSLRRKDEGEKVILLTNDCDANTIAGTHGVPARHFVHALAEFVCAGRLTESRAFDIFNIVQNVTGVPARECPQDADALRCLAEGDVCTKCDSFPLPF